MMRRSRLTRPASTRHNGSRCAQLPTLLLSRTRVAGRHSAGCHVRHQRGSGSRRGERRNGGAQRTMRRRQLAVPASSRQSLALPFRQPTQRPFPSCPAGPSCPTRGGRSQEHQGYRRSSSRSRSHAQGPGTQVTMRRRQEHAKTASTRPSGSPYSQRQPAPSIPPLAASPCGCLPRRRLRDGRHSMRGAHQPRRPLWALPRSAPPTCALLCPSPTTPAPFRRATNGQHPVQTSHTLCGSWQG